MTREEAIQWLKVINTKEFGWDEFALQESQREIRERCEQGVREAIDMAIEALQAEYEDYEHATLVDIKEPLKVAVVRCKDCRWWQDNNDGYPHANCHWCETETPDADDFCSLGERREE